MREGQWRESLLACERAVRLAPRNPDAHAGRLLSLVALGRYEDARSALTELGDALPARVVDITGAVLFRYGDIRGARHVLERCVEDL